MEPKAVAMLALTVRRSNPSARSHPRSYLKKTSYYLTDVTCGVLPEKLPVWGEKAKG
jgi:hypothetical protein